MGSAVWAAQPTTVTGTANGSAVTLSSHLTQMNFSASAENFYLKANNAKYDTDGGSIGFEDTVDIVTYDLRKHAAFARGAYWTSVVAAYACEGPSANSGSYGTLTKTISAMRIESSNTSDQGGRMAIQVTAKCLSINGTTAPVTTAIA